MQILYPIESLFNAGYRRVLGSLLSTALILALTPSLLAQQPGEEVLVPRKVYQVKYAMLYSFGISTTWTKEPPNLLRERPFVIGIVGGKNYPEYLQQIEATKQIQKRNVVIRWIEQPGDVDDCDLLYMTKETTSEMETKILERIVDKSILVVGEHTEPSREFVINLVIVDGTVRFVLNSEAAKARNLLIDPRLVRLSVPTSVNTRPPSQAN